MFNSNKLAQNCRLHLNPEIKKVEPSRFFETPDHSNQKSFSFVSQTLHFYVRFFKLPDYSKQFLFHLEAWN